MNRGNLSRRGFLARSAGGLVAAGLPAWYAQECLVQAQENEARQRRRIGPNDRIVMAAIGTGTNRTHRQNNQPLRGERGYAIMNDAMGQNGVQMVAVCDVDRPNAEFAANRVKAAERGGSKECQILTDYRELLRNRDIDAVTIGTPDHWHAIIAVAAMKAGKDVYCEKPLTLTLNEGKVMVRTQRETGQVLQTGSQQRSDRLFRLACELVRNGRIGHVRRITTLIGTNPVGGPFPTEQVPEGLDYNAWLGRTHGPDDGPYTTNRVHYNFRWWYQYSGGKMTDWGAHHNDIAQWALGMDGSGPVSVQGTGQAPSADRMSYNCHPQFEAIYTYANGRDGQEGTQLVCRSGPPQGWSIRNRDGRVLDNGVLFEGQDNKWIFVNRGNILASDEQLLKEPLGQDATRLEVSQNHMGNFIECMRSRKAPIANVKVGHRSVSVCHLGNIAIRFFPGQRLTWNPQDEQFTGANAEQANSHLDRPYRTPYRLEA